MMKRVYIVCEGPTEEKFIKTILAEYLLGFDISVTPICIFGVSNFRNIKKVLIPLGKGDTSAYVTTMFDYYAFPIKDLQFDKIENDIYATVKNCENAIFSDVQLDNFLPNLVIHEFEGLLFSDVDKFACCMSKRAVKQAQEIRKKFLTPEHINNSYATAPSRRIKGIFPEYNKVIDGTRIAQNIGIETICRECKHFAEWINKIIEM